MRVLFIIPLLAMAAFLTRGFWAGPQLHNVTGCRIFSMSGKLLKEVGGGICAFLPDGSYISGHNEDHVLFRADRDGKVLWRENIQPHHQLQITGDGAHFILLTGTVHTFRKQPVRFDRIEVRDLQNHPVKAFDFYEHRDELMKLAGVDGRHLWKIDKRFNPLAPQEFSHLNSVYEIPENAMAVKIPAFAKGGYVVNANCLSLVFILDAKMEKILWSVRQTVNHEGISGYHDVQILPSGKLLVYNNRAYAPQETTGSHTAIWELDPLTNAPVLLYEGIPWPDFSGPLLGGVQVLKNGNLLLSDQGKGGRGFEVTRDREIVWELYNPSFDPVTKRPYDIQDMKRYDLSQFLKNSREF